MKRTALAFIACFCMLTGNISAKSLVLTLKDGTLVYYLLGGDCNPMMRFVDGKVAVDTDNYTISDIKNFYISEQDDPNAIEDIKSDKADFSYSNNALTVKTGNAKSVKVFAINGSEVEAEIKNASDMTTIGLEKLPKGTYIVRVGNTSFKVTKK